MKKIAVLLLAWAIGFGAMKAKALFATEALPRVFDHSHKRFDHVLKKFMKDGLVDYSGLKANSGELHRYLDELSTPSETDFGKWTEKEQLAYLINLYNATTLRLIVDHYPVKSVKDIGNLLKGPWDQPVVRLFGRKATLNTIEHDLLRKNYEEPRIHFALVCAARSCPPLRSEAYTAGKLDEQLNDQGRKFLSTPEKNSVNVGEKTIYLSLIFKWFGEDFSKKSGSVLSFVKIYFRPEISKELDNKNFKIKYTRYDWSLNEPRSA